MRPEVCRRRAAELARDAVQSPRYQELLLSLGAWLAAEPWLASLAPEGLPVVHGPVADFARQGLERQQRRLRKRGRGFARLAPAERHRLRIAAKKLRYAGDFFSALFPGKETRSHLRSLAALQDELGALNDAATTEHLVRDALEGIHDPAAAVVGLSASFQMLWQHQLPGQTAWGRAVPAVVRIGADPVLVFNDLSGAVTCLTADGHVAWTNAFRAGPCKAPAQAFSSQSGEELVLIPAGSNLICCDAKGHVRWQTELDGEIITQPEVLILSKSQLILCGTASGVCCSNRPCASTRSHTPPRECRRVWCSPSVGSPAGWRCSRG